VVRGALSYTQVTYFHGAILIAGPVPGSSWLVLLVDHGMDIRTRQAGY
jgi:hypothetical protein